MTTGLTTGYAHTVDQSTPQTLRQTLIEASNQARAAANEMDAKARDLRTEAAGLSEKPDMSDTAERLLREAAGLEETAEKRRGMAAAYDDRAATVAA